MNTYLDCAAKWYYKYALGLPEPPTAALALGSALHTAAAAALRGKGAGNAVPHDFVIELLHERLTDELRELPVFALDDSEIAALHTQAEAMLRVWLEQALPYIHPAAVEVPLHGTIGGVEIAAAADCITRDGVIIDLKTASKKPAGVSHSHAFQLATYAILAGHEVAAIHTLTKTKTPAYVPQTITIDDQARAYPRRIYPAVQQAMRDGTILPRRNGNLCSRTHCPYWEPCEAEYGGQVKA